MRIVHVATGRRDGEPPKRLRRPWLATNVRPCAPVPPTAAFLPFTTPVRSIGASAASQLGDWLFNAALLGYVYSATGSAGWVGAATICRLLPYVLLGPVGGMIADRYDRRTVLLVGDLLRVLAHARPRRRGRDRRPGRARDRPDRAGLGGGNGRAAGGDGDAPSDGRRVPAGARQRSPAHGAGPRCGRRSGNRSDPARGRARCGGVPRQRSHVRGVGGAHLDDAAPRGPRGHAARSRACAPS